MKRTLVFFLCFFVLFDGCFTRARKNIKKLQECQIHLVGMSVKRLPGSGLGLFPNLEITPILEVKNPNLEEVEIYEFDLDLFLNMGSEKEELGKIKNTEMHTIPAGEGKTFPLLLELNQEEGLDSKIIAIGLRLIAGATRGEESEFTMQGTVSMDLGLGKIPVPIKETRKLRIK